MYILWACNVESDQPVGIPCQCGQDDCMAEEFCYENTDGELVCHGDRKT